MQLQHPMQPSDWRTGWQAGLRRCGMRCRGKLNYLQSRLHCTYWPNRKPQLQIQYSILNTIYTRLNSQTKECFIFLFFVMFLQPCTHSRYACTYIQKTTSWMAKEFTHLVNPIDLGLESSLVSNWSGNHPSQQCNSSDIHTSLLLPVTGGVRPFNGIDFNI